MDADKNPQQPRPESVHLKEPEDSTASDAEWLRKPIYASFYGLTESPFDLTPNPRFLFLTNRQKEALSNLRYGLTTHKGMTLLLGDAGTGKTTLVRTILGELQDTASRYVLVSNPTLGRTEFYEHLAREFDLSDEARTSKTQFLQELQEQVEARNAAGGLTGLIVDEAQSLPYELLEEIRLLGNIETETTKLLNIVLSGQPELADRLNEPTLRQLKQRIALRCELRALSLDETAAYVSGRLRMAGGLPQNVFTRQVVMAIHEASGGIPRVINVLCDNALITGFATQAKPISLDIVAEVCRDFDINGRRVTPPAVPTVSDPPAKPGSAEQKPKEPAPAKAPAVRAERPMFSSLNSEPKKKFSFFQRLRR